MDIATQALLGSVVAVSGARKSEIKHAAWIGAGAGLLADTDVLINSSTDPLLFLEYHRFFTHSLIFVPVGALIAAGLFWLISKYLVRSELMFRRVYYYSFLGYMLSGVLDAFTSYGTHLLWPFSDERVAWSLISIVDPMFSGFLLVSIVVAIKTGLVNSARIGLVLCGFYLVLSYMQSQSVYKEMLELASSRGHQVERFVVKPTFGNIVLWRTLYQSDDRYYIDAVHTLSDKVIEGVSVKALNIDKDLARLSRNSVQYRDVERFKFFSDGYVAMVPGKFLVIGDVRYSIIPNAVKPLWGIELNPGLPDRHVKYATFRDNNAELRRQFIDMVLGRELLE